MVRGFGKDSEEQTLEQKKKIIGVLEKAETKKENIKIEIREVAKNHPLSCLRMSEHE